MELLLPKVRMAFWVKAFAVVLTVAAGKALVTPRGTITCPGIPDGAGIH